MVKRRFLKEMFVIKSLIGEEKQMRDALRIKGFTAGIILLFVLTNVIPSIAQKN
jgi:hypothetical protein